MIIDSHGHVTAPDALYVYKAGLLAHRGGHGRGSTGATDDDIRAALHKPVFGGTSHLEQLKEAGIDMQLLSPRPYQMMHSEDPKLVRWYIDHGIKPTFEIVPGMYDETLGAELTRPGFYQSDFHASLIGRPSCAAPDDGTAEIERVTTAKTMEDYLDAYVAGWGFPEKDHAQFKANVRPWLEQVGWSLYVARVNGKPAAAATLYLQDGVGYLADSATDPVFRGRGLQLAMLQRRMRDADAAEADLVFSGARPFSSSHRNMERAGLRLQFIRSKWTQA